MERRTITLERNSINTSKDENKKSKSGINYNYGNRSSEDSTTEDEVEFEGWIEFVSKKDSKNKKDKDNLSNKSEIKLKDSYKKNSTNRISFSRNGKNIQKSETGITNGSKKRLSDRESDTINFKCDENPQKTNTIHAQIHAQILKSGTNPIQNPTAVQISNLAPTQMQAPTQLQVPTQLQIPSQMQVQVPTQTNIQIPAHTNIQIPAQTSIQIPAQTSIQIPAHNITNNQHHAQFSSVQAPIQYVQQESSIASPNVVLQPNVQQVMQTAPQQVHMQHMQQLNQPMQQIQHMQQIQQIQQPIQQQIHQIQQPVQQQIHQIHQIQQPIQQQTQVVNGYIKSNFTDPNGLVFMDAKPPLILNSDQNHSPVYVQNPPTVVVANQPKPPIVINPPPANVILENQPPQPIYVNNPRPNIIMKNSTSSMNSSNLNALTVQAGNANFAVDNFPSQLVMQQGGAGTAATMMPNGSINAVDNHKHMYALKRNANGTATFVPADFMHNGNLYDPRSSHMPSNVYMTNMGNTQSIQLPRHLQLLSNPQSCMQNMYSCLNPSVGLSGETPTIAGNILDIDYMSNAHPIDYIQELGCNPFQQFISPSLTPIMNGHHVVHMPQHPHLVPMPHIGRPQIVQAHEMDPNMFYENNFLPHTNEPAIINNHMHHLPLPLVKPFCIPPQTPPAAQMMNTLNGCATPMMMPGSRSPNLRQTQLLNMQRINSIPSGCNFSNATPNRRNSFYNRHNNAGSNKVEITAKVVPNRMQNRMQNHAGYR